MDTSREYILQCEKAEEIQKLWEPDDGDFIHCDSNICTEVHVVGDHFKYKDPTYTWLPRQDQLQEMIGGTWSGQLFRLDRWIKEFGKEYYACTSMEQLWLGFVMTEKFNKKWDGESWIGL